MIKVLIVDDEQSAINIVKDLLAPYDRYKICGEAKTVQTAIELTCIEKPNLVFLDIVLGKKTGFDYLNTFLPNIDFKVIFITAYNEFAIKAFEFSALHYLLKPIIPKCLEEALSRMNDVVEQRQYIERFKSLENDLKNKHHHCIYVNTVKETHKIDFKDILYLKSEINYTHFQLLNQSKITSSKTLKFYDNQLDKKLFFRNHESYIINVLKVKKYQKRERKIIMEDGAYVPVATRRVKDFLKVWCKLKN